MLVSLASSHLHSCIRLVACFVLRPIVTLPACTGKTTLLRHLLSNSKLKIGCIVNDVANVNIDAKLIRNNKNKDRDPSKNTTKDLADTIELANGCACVKPPSSVTLHLHLPAHLLSICSVTTLELFWAWPVASSALQICMLS